MWDEDCWTEVALMGKPQGFITLAHRTGKKALVEKEGKDVWIYTLPFTLSLKAAYNLLHLSTSDIL